MNDHLAILVEDDAEQVPRARKLFEDAGFQVQHFYDASSAYEGVLAHVKEVRLIILDRRLPPVRGEQDQDEVGDQLLDSSLAVAPDVPFLVFSGHSDYAHLQKALSKRGTISLREGECELDRVTVLKKGQAPEAQKFAREVRDHIRNIANIEVLATGGLSFEPSDQWLLKRVGYEYGAKAVRIRPLVGGATGAEVWICALEDAGGATGEVVIKRSKKRARGDGLQALLPAGMAAATVKRVHGLSGGLLAQVMQPAGKGPVPLDSLIQANDSLCVAVTEQVISALDDMPHGNLTHLPLRDVVLPFAAWEEVILQAERHGYEVPDADMEITTRSAQQHGDLHPGNVLVVQGRAVLIDFDSQVVGSRLVDPVAMLLGGAFHRASSLRSVQWPMEATFAGKGVLGWKDDAPYGDVVERLTGWMVGRSEGEREMYAVLLGFASRQLTYRDVQEDSRLEGAAAALARWCCAGLGAS